MVPIGPEAAQKMKRTELHGREISCRWNYALCQRPTRSPMPWHTCQGWGKETGCRAGIGHRRSTQASLGSIDGRHRKGMRPPRRNEAGR